MPEFLAKPFRTFQYQNLPFRNFQSLDSNKPCKVAAMVKRKREETESGQVDSAKRQRVQHKLKVGVTKIGHAFKVSKGFERQKLGRRRKTAAAKSNAQDVQRIDSEIAALKVRYAMLHSDGCV